MLKVDLLSSAKVLKDVSASLTKKDSSPLQDLFCKREVLSFRKRNSRPTLKATSSTHCPLSHQRAYRTLVRSTLFPSPPPSPTVPFSASASASSRAASAHGALGADNRWKLLAPCPQAALLAAIQLLIRLAHGELIGLQRLARHKLLQEGVLRVERCLLAETVCGREVRVWSESLQQWPKIARCRVTRKGDGFKRPPCCCRFKDLAHDVWACQYLPTPAGRGEGRVRH